MHLKFKKISAFSSILVLSLVVSSCFSIKQNFNKGAKKHYEAFYVGDEGTQYFIKPLKFKKQNGEELLLDVTLRKKNKVTSSPTLNMSIMSDSYIKKINQIEFINDDIIISSEQIKLLYNELDGNDYVSRFTNTVSPDNISELFSQKNWKIKIYLNDAKIIYKATNKTSRIIGKLNHKLFLEN